MVLTTLSMTQWISEGESGLTCVSVLHGGQQALQHGGGQHGGQGVWLQALHADEGLGLLVAVRLPGQQHLLQHGQGLLARDLTVQTPKLLDNRDTQNHAELHCCTSAEVCRNVYRVKPLQTVFLKALGPDLGELVQAEDLLAVALAVMTLVHQPLQLTQHLVLWGGNHHEGGQTGEAGDCRAETDIT